MKLRYLFSIILASVLFAGCVSEEKEALDNIKLSETYLSMPTAGGTVSVTITATEAWEFNATKTWPTDKDGNASWLAVDKMSGGKGETKVTFTAGEGAGRELELSIKAGTRTQFLRVIQGLLEVQEETCAQANQGPDGRLVRVSGVVTGIENFTYGNWTLKDDTGTLYIYGTLYKGQTKQFASLGLEEGDEVTIEGPRGSYKGNPQLVNVTVLKITKSLVKFRTEPLAAPLEKDAGEFQIEMEFKGDQLLPSVPAEYRDWISVVDIQTTPGTPSKLDPNPASVAVATVRVAENVEKAPRTGKVSFTSKKGKSSSTIEYKIDQKGNLPEVVSIVTLKTLALGEYVHIEGRVAALCTRGFIIDDGTAAVYAYFGSSYDRTYKIGDKISLAGKTSVYNFGLQVGSIDYDDRVGTGKFTYPEPKAYTAAELDAIKAGLVGKDRNKDAEIKIEYVKLSGTLSVSGTYYNLAIPGTTEVIGSITYPLESLGLADKNGQNITIYGYANSASSAGKYYNVIVTKVE